MPAANPRVTTRIDVPAGGHRRSVGEEESVDPIAFVDDLADERLLADLGAHRLGVPEQDVVVDRAIDLERRLATRPAVGHRAFDRLHDLGVDEVEVPELGGPPPAIGGADLQREPGPFDRIPGVDLVEDGADRGELALADMVARELLLLEMMTSIGAILLDEGREGGARRASTDDRDIPLGTRPWRFV